MWGFILIALGAFSYFQPEQAISLKKQTAVFFGMKMTSSKKTVDMFKKAGIVLMIVGVLLLLN